MELGNRIQNLRNINNMTAKELAERIDVSPSFVSSIENNSSKLSLKKLAKICEVLDVSLADFFNPDISPLEQKLISTIKQLPERKQYELLAFLRGLYSEESE